MILNGQDVKAEIVNPAFMSRLTDTSTVGKVDVNNPTESTSETTGALKTAGGLGVKKKSHLGGDTFIHKGLFVTQQDDETTGVSQILEAPDFVRRLTGTLTSVKGILVPELAGSEPATKLIIYVNESGEMIKFLDGSVQEVDEEEEPIPFLPTRIITGTGEDLNVPDKGSIWLLRDSAAEAWRVVGGSGIQIPDVFEGKKWLGGVASETSQVVLPSETKENLDLLDRVAGSVVYAEDEGKLYVDNGEELVAVGAGGGGGGGGAAAVIPVSADLTLADNGIYLVDTSSAIELTLPVPVSGIKIIIKDSAGTASTNNITVVRNASEEIEGLAASLILRANWGAWTLVSDGVDWFLL